MAIEQPFEGSLPGGNEPISPAREVFRDRLEEINAEFDSLQFTIEADRGSGLLDSEVIRKHKPALEEVLSKYNVLLGAVEKNGITDFPEIGPVIEKIKTLSEYFLSE